MSLFHAGLQPALDSNGNPIAGATWSFYETGTLTPLSVYANNALTVSLGSSETADAAGRFAVMFLDDSKTYRAILRDAGGTTIKDIDPANGVADDEDEVLYPVLSGEVGAFNLNYRVGDARRYGVFPDGSTDWESTTNYLNNILRTGLGGHRIYFPAGLYATGWNWTNQYGYDGLTLEFEEGAIFGGIVHFLSSGSPAARKVVTGSVSVGTTTSITFSGAHGLTIGAARYVTFEGTGMEALDGQEVLLTPTTTTSVTVAADTTGQVWSTTGEFTDVPFNNVTIKGTIASADRVGIIIGNGWWIDRIHCLDDPNLHYSGLRGRGCHIYLGFDNYYIGEIRTDGTGDQQTDDNTHGAITIDGPSLEPRNGLIMKAWVKDSGVNGIVLNCQAHIVSAVVDGWGDSTPLGTVSSTPATLSGTDAVGNAVGMVFSAIVLARFTGRIDYCSIDQKQGYGSGNPGGTRAFSFYGVLVEGTFVDYQNAYTPTFAFSKKGASIGHLDVGDIPGVAVAVGAFGQAGSLHIERIEGGIVSADNVLVTDASWALQGYVWCVHGELTWGKANFADLKSVTGIQVNSNSDASFSGGSVTVHTYTNRALWLRAPGAISGLTDLKARTGAGTLASIQVDGTQSQGTHLGPVRGRASSVRTEVFMLFAPVHGTCGYLDVANFAPVGANEAAVLLGANATNKVVLANGFRIQSTGSTGSGLGLNGIYDSLIQGGVISGFAAGVKVINTNVRLSAIGNNASSNTTATDLPNAQLVGGTAMRDFNVSFAT